MGTLAILSLIVVTAACSSASTQRQARPDPVAPTTGAASTTTAATAPAKGRGGPRPAAGATAPYGLDQYTLPLVDRTRPTVSHGVTISPSRKLTTLVWAPAARGRWPLVVFAHGYQVGPTPYVPLLRAWAERGYVVAAPEFPLTDEAVAGRYLDESDIVHQPADVRFVIDSLVGRGSPLAGRIDPDRVGVAGHSDGGETALVASLDQTPPGKPAIRGVIAMSVQPLLGVTATTNPPLLVTQGDADTINRPSRGRRTWAEAATPKYLAILHGGGHLGPLEEGSRWLPAVEATTEAFLRVYVAGHGRPASIVAAGSDPPLVTITAAGAPGVLGQR